MSGMRRLPPISMSSPAGHRHRSVQRQGVEQQQHRGGVVVHHCGRRGAGEVFQPLFHDALTVASAATVEVVFQRQRRGGGGQPRGRDGLAQRRSSQVAVQQRAGQVEDAPVAGTHPLHQPCLHRRRVAGRIGGPCRCAAPTPRIRLQVAHRRLRQTKAAPGDDLRQRRMAKHRGDTGQFSRRHGRSGSRAPGE